MDTLSLKTREFERVTIKMETIMLHLSIAPSFSAKSDLNKLDEFSPSLGGFKTLPFNDKRKLFLIKIIDT